MTLRFAAALLLASVATPAFAEPVSEPQRTAILADIDAHASDLSRTALAIWGNAELGFQEERSSALLQAELRNRPNKSCVIWPLCWKLPDQALRMS